jgi:hypothetical protein
MQDLLYFAHASSFSALLPAIFGLIFVKSLHGRLAWIPFLAFASLVSDGLSLMLLSRGHNTWPVVNLFLILQFIFLYLVLGYHLIGRWCDLLFVLCVLFSASNYLWIQTPNVLNSFATYVAAVLMIVVSGWYLIHLMTDLPVERVQDLPLFWISFAVLIYFAGTTFLFLFTNYLIDHNLQVSQSIWVLHNILNITKNVFFTIALWKQHASRTSY